MMDLLNWYAEHPGLTIVIMIFIVGVVLANGMNR